MDGWRDGLTDRQTNKHSTYVLHTYASLCPCESPCRYIELVNMCILQATGLRVDWHRGRLARWVLLCWLLRRISWGWTVRRNPRIPESPAKSAKFPNKFGKHRAFWRPRFSLTSIRWKQMIPFFKIRRRMCVLLTHFFLWVFFLLLLLDQSWFYVKTEMGRYSSTVKGLKIGI